jgi:hypothetical protein
VNLCGCPLPETLQAPVRHCNVDDPIGRSEKVYRKVRDQIEALVLSLIEEMRAKPQP